MKRSFTNRETSAKKQDFCDRAVSGKLSSNLMLIVGLPKKKMKTNLVYFRVLQMQPFFLSAISNVYEESKESK